VTLCPACFNAVAAVRPAIPAPTMRTFSCAELLLEPIGAQVHLISRGDFLSLVVLCSALFVLSRSASQRLGRNDVRHSLSLQIEERENHSYYSDGSKNNNHGRSKF
jgi:hypothetical protein